jgi:hypothetical protein
MEQLLQDAQEIVNKVWEANPAKVKALKENLVVLNTNAVVADYAKEAYKIEYAIFFDDFMRRHKRWFFEM